MPALKPATGIARLVFNGTLESTPTAMVWHIQGGITPVAWSQNDLNLLVTNARASYVTQFGPRQAPLFTLGAVTAQDLTTEDGLSAIASGSTAGVRAGTALPANCALCVSWKTNGHFRGGRWRQCAQTVCCAFHGRRIVTSAVGIRARTSLA